MEAMERIGVPRKIVAFVMPTGYSFNLDGTTLYLSLAAIFVAQAAGMPLTFGQQVLIVFTLMLTSKGVAGVPRASLVILLGTASSFGMPVWPIFIILGIDELSKCGDPGKAGFFITTGIILSVLALVSFVLSVMSGSFSWTGAVGFALPALYIVGGSMNKKAAVTK
jgi:hypothetical protein